jgi:hypothetical protein
VERCDFANNITSGTSVDKDGFYDAMGDMGEAEGEFLRGDAVEEDGGVRLDADAPSLHLIYHYSSLTGDGPLLQ